MKRIFILALCCIAAFCCCKRTANTPVEPQVQEEETYLTAIDKYMTEVGTSYAPGAFCIPYSLIVASDDSNPEEILVYGDFWVDNYNQEGDTLKTVSGGSHPGLMHVGKTADGYAVSLFDAVGDGSDFLPTAKAIFGEYFDAFMTLQSDDEARKTVREKAIADYVAANEIPVSYYQDFGWPAVKLP